jgi:osmotically-inducible protein OsmY
MIRVLAILIPLIAVGCKQSDARENAPMNAADNTGKNARDRGTEARTPMDQGETESDRTISQQIRSEVVKDDALSVNGKNVKIIAIDGVVTLRGPVETAREKADIAKIAKHVEGVKRIENQLEVAAK